MGKRRFNEKGRQHVETIIDNSATKQIKLDFGVNYREYGSHDEANLLVLPSKKRPTKIKHDKTIVTKILSKKQRKRLERIVDQKKKKENRSSLIAALAKVQVPAEELKSYLKISALQTKGLKQYFKEQNSAKSSPSKVLKEKEKRQKHKYIGTSKKHSSINTISKQIRNNLHTVGFDDSSEEEICNDSFPVGNSTESNALEYTPCNETTEIDISVQNVAKNTKPDIKDMQRKPVIFVHVDRDSKIQAARLRLPILAEEQIIMETISENTIVILAGETGSGKTTQVPQFLYEAGYALPERGIIAITEPRRVAAISMSKRVAKEMNLSEDIVSYLIRFEGNVTDKTRIKFLTDGVLLKEIQNDFLLNIYSVVILDEAHERSVYTDILIGLLSRIVILRAKKGNPLKLIIMSATLRVKDFTENHHLFSKIPPVINVESRQFPVTVHFNKTTATDYVRESILKTMKIHTRLPEGGILVFVTGQKEVNYVVKRLRNAFPYKNACMEKHDLQKQSYELDRKLTNICGLKNTTKSGSKRSNRKSQAGVKLPKINLDNYEMPWDTEDLEKDQVSDSESDFDEFMCTSEYSPSQSLWVLPLYSLLSSEKQQRIFDAPPEGTRLCVVATNVAETSLTIPDIKYVVDCGRQKTKLYDKVTGVSTFAVTYISKASANQRAGRAGRVAPGHCYRLYSSALYNDEFIEFTTPQIQVKPVDDLMLQMKSMGIDKVVNFPFPSPPDRAQLKIAENQLVRMGALQEYIVNKKKIHSISRVTELGRTIAAFPVSPRFGKMLALSHQYGLLPYAICMVAALSVQEVLQEVSFSENSNSYQKWRNKRKAWAGTGNSFLLGDPMILLRAVGASEFANSKGRLAEFCEENGLRLKAIKEIRKLRVLLTNESNANLQKLNLTVDPLMPPPNDAQARLLRQLMLIGMADRVARKIPDAEIKLKSDRIKYKHAYNISDVEEPVFIHTSSVHRKQDFEWVCYQEVYETMDGGTTKMFIRGITVIEPEWLPQLVPSYCNVIVQNEPEPTYDAAKDSIMCSVKATVGKSGWSLPITMIEMPDGITRSQYFSKFFLAGDVCPKLKKFREFLLSSPDTIVKTYSSTIPRINALVKTIHHNEIYNRTRLEQLWKTDQNFLLDEYMQFLPASCQEDVRRVWPPVNNIT
ncbi:probable ATP-dependent RNA helicase kurz [Sabethes cyaneus]|uniref:probable ATP-dependent RNA helicase kurz n=1 Tax=Sabethes cyaneus TaxID=53552 RepID=UPI00237DF17E|nr:probable ATP-dependent RNA helicase kurz [Sabethes cyaneus]